MLRSLVAASGRRERPCRRRSGFGSGRVRTVTVFVTVLRAAADAIRIGHHEARFVGGIGLEIQNAAGEHVRRDDIQDAAV